MNEYILIFIIAFPAIIAAFSLLISSKVKWASSALLLVGFGGNLALVLVALLSGGNIAFFREWVGYGINFSLKFDHFAKFILTSGAALTFFIAIYTAAFSKGKQYTKLLYSGMLFTIAMVNGAVLANNLAVMLFFWEAILITMYAMILSGGKKAQRTSIKALVIAGVTDLCMMLGIGIAGYIAGTLQMDEIRHLPIEGWGAAAFVLLAIGAVSKAGSMPFHTWIPDAADDAPTPFLPFLPGALEKLLGIYLLGRLCLDLFEFEHGSPMSMVLMILGVCTIIFAVLMALIQRDFKRLLSYHAISQVGYMMLGIGTGLPVGIVGGLFHMVNHAAYKCVLFFTAGAVEKQTGTTNLNILGGLRKKMPVTFICFIIAAASIAGFPMTNGFFSKELIFDGAIESGMFFYIVAAIGAFFTAVSFLKLGHSAFFGKETEATKNIREVPFSMQLPMIVLALGCLALGVFQSQVVQSILTPLVSEMHAEHVEGHTNWLLVGISAALLLLACLDHYLGFKRTGKGIESADHFHHAPLLRTGYAMAEKKYFDPYEMARRPIRGYAAVSLKINDAISHFYDKGIVSFVNWLSKMVRKAHNGSQSRYTVWVLAGLILTIVIYLIY